MKPNLMPFNIDLLIPDKNDVSNLRPIKVLDIFEGLSRNFHPDGLFSIDTFGKVGEEKRNRMYSYIDLKMSVLHPIIFKTIVDLRSLYGDILASRKYAVFNTETKDFDPSTPADGETGYAFFIKYLPDLVYEERPSHKREFSIKLMAKYKDNYLIDKLIVMPAGLRDYTVDDEGKPSEDEINTLYRKVLSLTSLSDNIDIGKNEEYLDISRYNLQLAIGEIYDYIKSLLEGKHKLISGKWTSRKVFNSTRNVITSYLHKTDELGGDTEVSTNQSIVGMYQYMRSILPLAVKLIRDTYLSDIFTGPNSPAILVNKKTLKKESVSIDPIYYDEWMTYEGIEKLVAKFAIETLRHEVLEIDDHYFGLIYKGPDMTFRFLQDIDDLPSDKSVDDVYPITLTELLYISIYKESVNIPCLITRYPVTGYGSIYPSYIYLKTTIDSEVRSKLNEDWSVSTEKGIEFPKRDSKFFDSVAVASKHLARLGADYDGDLSFMFS